MTYLVWDCETTITGSFKRKANPFDPANHVVVHGWYSQVTRAFGHERFGKNKPPAGWFKRHLTSDIKILVGSNIKFDLLHMMQDKVSREHYMDWIVGGGQLWDIQLAEYLLDGMQQSSHMLSLDEMAPRYGGTVKHSEVPTLWEAGVQTYDIEPELLRLYLMGDEKTGEGGDINNTLVVFRGQLERARKFGQMKLLLLNMGALVATTEMEFNGMRCDKELGMSIAQDLERERAELSSRINTYLPSDLPFAFNWGSRHQVSAFIFGGSISYTTKEPTLKEDGTQAYVQKDCVCYILEDDSLVPEHSVTEIPPTTVRNKSGKNKGEPKTKKVKVDDTDKPKFHNVDREYVFPGVTQPSEEWKTSVDGVYQTGAEIIEVLGTRSIPFLKDYARLAAVDKDLGTYFISSDKDGNPKGMLTLVQPDGIIHHSLNQSSTVTGRFSSSNPNLQNLSSGAKSRVKELFVSRFPNGAVIASDFSSLEVYVQALLSGDKNLIGDLKKKLDLHCMRLASKLGMPYEEVLDLAKVQRLPEWEEKRRGAKEFSFQRAYGAGAPKIAATTGMSIEDVQALIAAEEERYSGVETYYNREEALIADRRRSTNRQVPHPAVPGVMLQLGVSYIKTPDNKMYRLLEQPTPAFIAKRGKLQGFSPTEIRNYPVQGTGAEVMKIAMWLLVREFYRRRNFNGMALLINTIHDAAYSDAHARVQHEVAAVQQACMDAASDFLEWYYGWTVPVPVPCETEVGTSMADHTLVGNDVLEAARQVRLELRARYMQNYQPTFERTT